MERLACGQLLANTALSPLSLWFSLLFLSSLSLSENIAKTMSKKLAKAKQMGRLASGQL